LENKTITKVLIDNDIDWEDIQRDLILKCRCSHEKSWDSDKSPLSKLVEKGILVISEIEFAPFTKAAYNRCDRKQRKDDQPC
jgi:hypothetical protein